MALSKSPGDEPDQKPEPKEQDYFSKYLRLGKQSPDDAKYEPELQALLAKLYDRQREEAYRRMQEQEGELRVLPGRGHPLSTPPKILNEHREWDKTQNDRFLKERERYIRDHYQAKVIRDEMREKEKTETLERGQDGPKRSR